MRIALYARVSTTKRKGELREYEQNPAVQLDPMRKYCEAQGWQIVTDKGPHEDPQIADYFDRSSGVNPMRAAFGRLLIDAHRRRFDAVMVWKFDRMSRSALHLIQTLDTLNDCNVGFISLTERIDTTTPQGRVMFSIIASFAQFERDIIQERIRAGLDRARANGVKFGRPRIAVPVLLLEEDMAAGLTFSEAARKRGVNRETARRALITWRAAQKSGSKHGDSGENSDTDKVENAPQRLR